MQPVDRQPAECVGQMVDATVICGEHDPKPGCRCGKGFGGGRDRRGDRRVFVQDQHRFVELEFGRPRRRQQAQDMGVDRQQTGQQAQPVEGLARAFRKHQEADRAEQHRPRPEAQAARLDPGVDDAGVPQEEGLIGAEFGHEIVVVGVEPLGHFHGRQPVGRAARHGEIRVETDPAAGMVSARAGIDRGHRADHDGGVEHMIVEREVARGQAGDAGGVLACPAGRPQAAGGVEQVAGGTLSPPVGLQGGFEFTARADAGKAQRGGADQGGGHLRRLRTRG